MIRAIKWFAYISLGLLACVAFLSWYLHTSISDPRLSRMQASRYFEGGAFFNEERQAGSELGVEFLREQFFGEQQREPEGNVYVEPVDAAELNSPPNPGLHAIWLGHASVLIEIDGYRVLTDPVLSERASPFPWIGPRRTHPAPLALDDLSGVDAVVISHNHYDHLDEATIRHLASQQAHFFLPLGVGQYLEDWGIPASQFSEMEWWDAKRIGKLTIMATPSRHYSSRGLFDYKATHWSSWSIIGESHKAFYSGDTGYSNLFAEIGKRVGPFDLSVVKIGSYGPGKAWNDIHMTPEEAVRVHLDIGGRRMLPVHWMTFNLALHDWQEPISRALAAADANGVEIVAPRIGQQVDVSVPFTNEPWWEDFR